MVCIRTELLSYDVYVACARETNRGGVESARDDAWKWKAEFLSMTWIEYRTLSSVSGNSATLSSGSSPEYNDQLSKLNSKLNLGESLLNHSCGNLLLRRDSSR